MLLAPPSSSSGASGSSWLLGMPWTTISLDGSLDNRVSGSTSVPESSRLLGSAWASAQTHLYRDLIVKITFIILASFFPSFFSVRFLSVI